MAGVDLTFCWCRDHAVGENSDASWLRDCHNNGRNLHPGGAAGKSLHPGPVCHPISARPRVHELLVDGGMILMLSVIHGGLGLPHTDGTDGEVLKVGAMTESSV